MTETKEAVRPSVNYPQGIWADPFLSLSYDNSEFESYTKQVEELKETVKDILMVPTTDPLKKMDLIYSLCRLGVSYHFENEIEQQLNHLFIILPKLLLDDNDYDLHTVALVFQVFRFNCYKMPCGVFNKFLDGEGKFKEELIDNVKGMVSLYDASHFGTHGEEILDEALSFTTKKLRSLMAGVDRLSSMSPHLEQYIENALFRPYHHSFQRHEAKLYICFYEKEESRNDVLLKLAKYDFNRIQLMFQQELAVVSRWYKEEDFKSKFPYARHRLVEALFYAIGIYFEPRYAVGRYMLTKSTCLIGFVDDAYEAYGLYEELQYLTDAIERYDMSAMDELPADYQKLLLESLLSATEEAENIVQKQGRSYGISYMKTEWMKYGKAEQTTCRWQNERVFPTFEEYLEVGAYTGAALLSMTQILLGMEEADQNVYEWIVNKTNKVPRSLQISTRLYNDIVTNKAEEKRGFSTATACYMKQHKVSRDEATRAFRAIIADGWKDVNGGCMRPTPVPMSIVKMIINYHRLLDFAYRDDDEYTRPHAFLKQIIIKDLIEPIPLN